MSIDLLLLCANDLGMNSLKTFEGNIGLDIEQSKIDFKLDRKLTEEELKEVIKYNQYDCYATAQIANVLDSQNFLLSSVELLCDIYKLNKFK
jgi:predicted RecB family nuclease